jgi:hypothetical protein
MIEAMLLEIGREMIMGISEKSPAMSPDQEAMLAQAARDLLVALDSGEVNPSHAVQTMMAFNGNRGIFGWAGLAPRLPESLRGVGAYIFAFQNRREMNQEGFRYFLDIAEKEAAQDERLKRLVDELRDKASEP